MLLDLAVAFSACGKEVVTERVLQRVFAVTGDVGAQLGLAESYARQHKLDDAAAQFKEILKLTDDVEVVTAAATGLAVVTEELGDAREAARLRAQYRIAA